MNETNYQISLLKAMNNRLIKDEKMYQMICNTSSDAYLYYNFLENRFIQMGNWSHFLPSEINEIHSNSQILDEIDLGDRVQVLNCLSLENQEKEHDSVQFRMEKSKIWVQLEVDITYDEDKKAIEKLYRFQDITKLKTQNEELKYLAYYDSMTGLYNRNYFVMKLQEMAEEAARENAVISILFIDIDDFRKINDSMGMAIGDEVVQMTGQLLKEFHSDKILISHFNSDIFCVAIYDPYGIRTVDNLIHQFKSKLEEPFPLSNGMECMITVSIGIAEYPECAKEVLELIKCAEIVMFKSKQERKNGIRYYDSDTIQEFVENVALEQKLQTAIKKDGFFMCYQPQFSTLTKKIRGVEALVRCKDENGDIISPGKFIPLAEQNGSILTIGDWIIDKSIKSFVDWYHKYQFKNLVLSINISALQFKNSNFVGNLLDVLKKYHLPPNLLELEITETVLIDNLDELMEKMFQLKGYGIKFSMDDFGTGFSSLSYLRKLPIDTVKIDKSFVDTVVTDGPTRMIAELIVNLGKKMGFNTIAEGVEEEIQFTLLKDIGCENIQGFFFAQPMNEDKIEQLFSNLKNCYSF